MIMTVLKYAVAILIVAAFLEPVFAQEVVAVVPVSEWQQVGDVASSLILPILMAVLTAAAPLIVMIVKKYFGELGGQIAQAMLAAAAERAAMKSLNKPGNVEKVATTEIKPDDDVVDESVEYLKLTMPETIRRTGATDKSLRDLAIASLNKAILPGILASGSGPLGGVIGAALGRLGANDKKKPSDK